jgi:hypothetical protein
LYCGGGCQQRAAAVRWLRARIADGTLTVAEARYGLVRDEDYAKAAWNKLRFAAAGGYPTTRQVPARLRSEVIAQAGGRCARCGAEGHEIDHRQGSANDLSNLEWLCTNCHQRKTADTSGQAAGLRRDGIQRPSPRQLLHDLVKRSAVVRALLSERVLPNEPTRLCDSTEWDDRHRGLKKERRQRLLDLLREVFDKVPGEDFPSGASWSEIWDLAFLDHESMYDDGPCEYNVCPCCEPRTWGHGQLRRRGLSVARGVARRS